MNMYVAALGKCLELMSDSGMSRHVSAVQGHSVLEGYVRRNETRGLCGPSSIFAFSST